MGQLRADTTLVVTDSLPVDTAGIVPDSLITDSKTIEDNTEPALDTTLFSPDEALSGFLTATDTCDSERRMYQNPTVALFKSMVVPGWGQYGNRRYIKAGVYFGLQVWFVSSALKYRSEASDFLEQFQQADLADERNILYTHYENRRDHRNKYTWYVFFVAFFSMFDAYVDAHLSGFPILSEEATVGLDVYSNQPGEVSAAIRIAF